MVSLFPKSVALARRDGAVTTALIVTATALGVVTSLGVVSLSIPDTTERFNLIEKEIAFIKSEIEDTLEIQNDINESTRAQLDAISTALAELQAKPSEPKPRKPCLLLLVLAFYQIFGELFGSLLNNPYLCTRNVIAVKFTDVKIYEEFL